MKKIISVLILLLAAACSTGKNSFDEKVWKESVENTDREKLYAENYRDGKYFNPWMEMDRSGFFNFLKWRLTEKEKYSDEEEKYFPEYIKGAYEKIRGSGKRDSILWIGHNTFLLRIKGEYWITDPIFTKRALLPARKTPPGLSLEELNKLTGSLNVIISHNHYDHLDKESIKKMPAGSVFYVPKGLGKMVKGWTGKDVREMNWWDEIDFGNGSRLICLPAQHWSRRINQGVNESLWASYMLETGGHKIYLAMDSGYFIGYREFGAKFKDIDYAIIPVTAYHPRWFMHYAHVDVKEAIQAFTDLGAKYFIPAQWGAFKLGDNPPGYPGLDLKREIDKQNLNPEKFRILNIGEILFIGD